jgi:hypothetical protein
LFEPIDGFVEAENNALVGEVARRGKHKNLLFKITCEEGAFDVKLMDEKLVFNGNREEEAKGRRFPSGSILQLKIEPIGLSKPLGPDTGLVFNDLIVSAKFLLLGPCRGDGVMMSLQGNNFPDVVANHVLYLSLFSGLPLSTFIARHGLPMVGGLRQGDRESSCRTSSSRENIRGVDDTVDPGGMRAEMQDKTLPGWISGGLVVLRAAVIVIPLSHYFIFMWRGRKGLMGATVLITRDRIILVVVKRKIDGG